MANSYLTHTTSTPTNDKIMTFSFWIKKGLEQEPIMSRHIDASNRFQFYNLDSSAGLQLYQQVSGSVEMNLTHDRQLRDFSAWYHYVIAIDTTQATAANRVKIYINGELLSGYSTATYPAQNADILFNGSSVVQEIGRTNASDYYNGYMSHFAFVDGTALAPTVFGETDSTSGIWKFKAPSGVTWGTNGFHLKFENSGALGTDSSGNSNTFTVNGSLTQSLDTPSNNYCTFSPLHFGDTPPSDTYGTFSNGNTRYESSQGGSPYPYTCSTLAASSGKWYAEFKLTRIVNSSMIGITDGDKYTYLGNSGNKDACLFHDGNFYPGNSSFGNSFSDNDICGVAMDLDNMKVYFSKNGTWQNSGDPTSGATGTGAANIPTGGLGQFHFAFGDSSSNDPACSANFGSGFFGTTAITSAGSNGNGSLFEYDVPSGYYALNTKNLNTYG